MPHLIHSWEAVQIRRMKVDAVGGGCGSVGEVQATGRAVCRSCGEKIARGSTALETCYDFHGGGLAGDPYTGQMIQIHKDLCE